MNSSSDTIQVGMTHTFDCSYLPGKQEQLLVLQEESLDLTLFEKLLALGFRRSGETIYKPHCPHCQACLPIRIPVELFMPSRRQKRTLKQNQDVSCSLVDTCTDEHYSLYDRYIKARHHDGPMYPPSREQYDHFVQCSWHPPKLLELRLEGELIGVAVTDVLPNSLSAIYSFFAPELDKRSLGSFMILLQCDLARQMHKAHVYLGYQIHESRKMNYKTAYHPHEILTANGWQRSE